MFVGKGRLLGLAASTDAFSCFSVFFVFFLIRLSFLRMSANERLHAVDPRRRVDRSLYPKNADMPEFPGAVLLNHVGLR